MKPDIFQIYEKVLKETSGLVVTPDKVYLLESRLLPVAKKWNLDNTETLAGKVKAGDAAVIVDVVEAMTTNETSFFRDNAPYEKFKSFVLPCLAKNRATNRKIRIWSAACSSGQEPYSLAMLLKENESLVKGWSIEIVATDLSREILEQAKEGVYTQFEVQRGMPIQLLVKYFEQKGERWQIRPQIRSMVSFRQANLLSDFSVLGVFDVILCRNVLIYFDQPTKAKVLERMKKQLAPDGVLFLGGAETVLGITDAFRPLKDHRGLYVPQASILDAASAAAETRAGKTA